MESISEKKYKLTEESITFNGKTLYRIEAVIDFSNIKKGQKGGFIETERNLSHDGNAWVGDNAIVCENANVSCYARVRGNASISGNAKISDGALVYGNVKVSGNAIIYGHSKVFDYAIVYGNANVSGYAQVSGYSSVSGNACVGGNALLRGYANVSDYAKVSGNAWVVDNASVFDKAKVSGKSMISGYADVSGDANVCANEDYIVFQNWWSSHRYFTWTRSNNMWRVGCFYGTGEELINKAYKDSEKSGREYERIVKCVESILSDNKK